MTIISNQPIPAEKSASCHSHKRSGTYQSKYDVLPIARKNSGPIYGSRGARTIDVVTRRGIVAGSKGLNRRSHQYTILSVGARSGSVLSWIGQEPHHLMFFMTVVREYHEVGFAPTILRFLAIVVMKMRFHSWQASYDDELLWSLDVEVVCFDRSLLLTVVG